MSPSSASARERVLGAAGVVMIVAVVVGLVWFVVTGRTDSALSAPPPTSEPTTAQPASLEPSVSEPTTSKPTTSETSSPSPSPSRSMNESPSPSPSPNPNESESPTPSESPSPTPSESPSSSPSDPGSAFAKPLTQKGLPTDDDLAGSGQDWSSEASYDGPGEAPSLCLSQDLTTLGGLRQIYRRDFASAAEGYGTALIFDFDDVDAATVVADALVDDALGCRAPLKAAGFQAKAPVGPTDVAIPEGIRGRTVDVSYRQGPEQPLTHESLGVARAQNRVLFLSLVVRDGEDDAAPPTVSGSLPRAAERLTR